MSHQTASSQLCDSAVASLCQSQQRCVKASIVSNWTLAEAQDQLCSLGVHSSESLEQERARTLTCQTELTHTEEEWRRKESMLGGQEPSRSPVLGASGSWDVFDKVSVQESKEITTVNTSRVIIINNNVCLHIANHHHHHP